MRQAYRITKRTDKNIGLILLLWFLLVGGVFAVAALFVFGTGTSGIIFATLFGLLSGLLAVLIVFGRRAERAAYAAGRRPAGCRRRGAADAQARLGRQAGHRLHQEPGRRAPRRRTPGHHPRRRGQPVRVRGLLSAERKKHVRIGGEEIPVHEIVVGDGDGEVRLTKLNKHVQKMKKSIKPGDQTALMNKLKALDAMRPAAPMPRGPMPTSMKGARKMMQG